MRAAILLIALLAGCRAETSHATSNEAAPSTPKTSPLLKEPGPAPKAFSLEEDGDLYTLEFSYPAEAAAIPQLIERFGKEIEKARPDLDELKEEQEERLKSGFDYLPYATHVAYETAGQSEQLLSLGKSVYSFTGGAHGSTGSSPLLWDRQRAREIGIPALLQPGAGWTGAIRQPFCVLLDREREKRREEPVRKDDLFGNCPEYGELTILLSDDNRNGRFDHLLVIADQYVAGPYAEGPYEIALPITAKMIERLKPEYASSFEPRPPVR